MNLVLIGYRGSGKSSVGRLVADRLGLGFVDTDARIVERFDGMTIKAIWQAHGEPAFRKVEREVIADLLGEDGRVIAFGGGAAMQPEVRAALADTGDRCKAVYLRATPATLSARIIGDAATAAARPSLTGAAGSAEEVADVLARREPTYQALADHTIDVDGREVEAVAEAIVALVEAV